MLKPKEIIVIGLVLVLLSPVLYFIMLLLTGNARIEFGSPKENESTFREDIVKVVRPSLVKDTLLAQYSKTYQAYTQERQQLQEERSRIEEEKSQINLVKDELENERKALQTERKKFESLVGQKDSLELKKLKQISKVYAAMRPAEAARILETLDDALVARILGSMGDAGVSAKILQNLQQEKATSVTALMGRSIR
jgi:flagellar motility protein MotE (MotC chaperone)